MAEHRRPGLSSLNESRANRYRQITTGKTAIGGIPPKLFLAGLAALVIFFVVYFYRSQSQLDEAKEALLAKQRATAELLGPKLLPVQQIIEASVAELAAPTLQPQIEGGVDWDKLLTSPGLYLRLALDDARDVKKVRKAASESLRDGFTSCLIRDPRATPPHEGKPCARSADCEAGQLCTEYQVCQRPSSPFNMRLLYRALQVLSEEWVSEVREAKNELGLVAYERGLDAVTQIDIPVAIDVYQRSRYVVLVLDETPAAGLPEEIPDAFESTLERLTRIAHKARVGVWELPSGKQLARLEAEAAGELRDVGPRSGARGGLESEAARARQANSCGLALEVRSKLQPAEPEGAPGPAAEPTH